MQYIVQQNGNKQHFTINSATSSNPANRTLESIYHTFNFVLLVRPEVNPDVDPCGLDRICEQPRVTELTQRLTEWFVSPSLRRRMLNPQQSLTIVVPGRINALMMASNVSAERSAKGARQVFAIHAGHQQLTLSRATGHNYTFAEVSILYFHNIATPANHH